MKKRETIERVQIGFDLENSLKQISFLKNINVRITGYNTLWFVNFNLKWLKFKITNGEKLLIFNAAE